MTAWLPDVAVVGEVPQYPATLWELLERRAAATPDRVLLEDEHVRSITAAEWKARSERVAAALYEQGVRAGQTVSWQLPTTIEAAVLLFALCRLDVVQNPLIPILRLKDVSFITTQTRSSLLITPTVWRGFDYQQMATAVAEQVGCETMAWDLHWLPEGDASALPAPSSGADDPVRHLYYSSGTTADPKGGRHTDRSLMAGATGLLMRGARMSGEDCIPIAYPYTHIGGIATTVASIVSGGRILLIESFDRVTSPAVMGAHGATILGSTLPFFLAYMDAQRALGPTPLFPRLRTFTSGGAPTPPEVHYQLKELFGVVGMMSCWGMTEFPIATLTTLEDSDEDLAQTEGQAVPGVELRVVGADGTELPAGEEGELRLRGPQMIRGYVDSSLDAAAFDDQGYFCSGDLGVIGPRGHVRITGRLKDVIIRNAENISAVEIESVLYTHPKIADVAVIGVPDERTGERACAVVVLNPGHTSLSLSEVGAFAREAGLSVHKIPERIEIVDQLPRNSLGKVLKQELRTDFRE